MQLHNFNHIDYGATYIHGIWKQINFMRHSPEYLPQYVDMRVGQRAQKIQRFSPKMAKAGSCYHVSASRQR